MLDKVSIRAAGLIVAGLGLNVGLVCYVTGAAQRDTARTGQTLTSEVFGSVGAALSDFALLKADRYLHAQTSLVASSAEEDCHDEETPAAGGKPSHGESGHVHTAECEHEEHAAEAKDVDHDEHAGETAEEHAAHAGEAGGAKAQKSRPVRLDPFRAVHTLVHPTQHRHLRNEAEILPWFLLAARFNPRNIAAYLDGAYILRTVKRPDAALTLLEQGLAANPREPRLLSAQGQTHFAGRQFGAALVSFRRSVRAWSAKYPSNEDRAETLTFMAGCFRNLGDLDRELASYRYIVQFVPERRTARERLQELEVEAARRRSRASRGA
jgi:tetratricopeptide (TPR) repeat protein